MPAAMIGPFQVQRELGRGGMGEVYLGRDTRLDRPVAIKSLPAHLAADPARLERFHREARILASLNHPGISAIHGLEQDDGHQYLILEYVEGETLAARLRRGAIPVEDALPVARQIAEALEAAHEKGIVHRDLKPGNVMLRPDGVVKVLDFGLARSGEPADPATGAEAPPDSPTVTSPVMESPTLPGAIMGTAGYMSPEQARGKPVDKRSDIFSFGCVLYQMLSGQQPFAAETVTDALAAVLHADPAFERLPAATPPRIRELLAACLAKERRNRLHDIADARLEIERAIAAREWVAPASRAGSRGADRRGVAARIAAAVALIGGGALLGSVAAPRLTSETVSAPVCLVVETPPETTVVEGWPWWSSAVAGTPLSRDGRTLLMRARPKNTDGSADAPPRLYARGVDEYEWRQLPGTEGALWGIPTRDSRRVLFAIPVTPGAAQKRLVAMPLDGSAPATTLSGWEDGWVSVTELERGYLIATGETTLIRVEGAGAPPSAPIRMDAGRSGIHRIELTHEVLPRDRGVLVNAVIYDAGGWRYNVGVLDPATGRVRIVVEGGGNAVYWPPDQLLFARGGDVYAVKFDADVLQARGEPAAVWSGLETEMVVGPGYFSLTDGGALCYRPGRTGRKRRLAIIEADGRLKPWSTELWSMDGAPEVSHDGAQIACSLSNERGIDEIWLSSVEQPGFARLGSDPSADCWNPAWSPDGARIAYHRRGRDGRDGVYLQETAGGPARRVMSCDSDFLWNWHTSASWLPDGSALLVSLATSDYLRTFLLPVGEREIRSNDLRAVGQGGLAKPSADGRLIAFISAESGRNQSYVAELRPGGGLSRPVMVRTPGSQFHAWSPDGRSLYVQDERERLLQVPVDRAPSLSIGESSPVADLYRLDILTWTPLTNGRFFVGLKTEGEREVTRYDVVLNWASILQRGASGKR